jgi:hypothetical protein
MYECAKCKHTFKVFADTSMQNSILTPPTSCRELLYSRTAQLFVLEVFPWRVFFSVSDENEVLQLSLSKVHALFRFIQLPPGPMLARLPCSMSWRAREYVGTTKKSRYRSRSVQHE